MALIQYLVSATLCISIAYLTFRLLFDHTVNFRQQRFFLIFSLAVSLLLPLTGFRIDLHGLSGKPPMSTEVFHAQDPGNISRIFPSGHKDFLIYADTAAWIYFSIATAFIVAIVIHLIKILKIYSLSQKKLHGKRIILSSTKVENPFSFFHWIFIPSNVCDPEERKSIITHESIHVSQYHSIDNLLIELTAAAMWFNPLVWMMKKSFHLIHEYLADEGTLTSGVDRLRYQAFLLNRVTEESLICLPSGFNQSLIKKRMIMMTKSKIYGRNKFRILALVPLSAVLLLLVSLLNGLFPQKAQAGNPEPKQPGISGALPVGETFIQKDTLKKKIVTVKVITQTGKNDTPKHVKIISDSNGSDTVIYIVNGKRHKEIDKINPDSIESVNVIKDKKEVIVTLKHPVKIEDEIGVVEPVEVEHEIVVVEPVEAEHEIVVEPGKTNPEQILVAPGKVSFPDDVIYYINGRKVSKAEVDKINIENIESVSVYKEGVKEADVSEKGVGVVKIITKKPEKP